MALSKPNFSLIPSAKKAGKLYSPIPSNGDGDFTFARNSVATFTNKDGYLETAPIDVPRLDYRGTEEVPNKNLLLYSEQFDNSGWTKVSSTIETNTEISPDGTMTADKWSRTTVSNNRLQQNTTKSATATKYSLSVYAKKINEDYFSMRMGGLYPARVDVIFNLSSGTIVSENAIAFTDLVSSITYVGNGWYRCSVSAITDATTSLSSLFSASDNPLAQVDGAGTSDNASVFLWGAQLELGAEATSYQKRFFADTVLISNLLTCPELLLEERRINTADYGQTFNNAVWIESNLTKEYNKAIAPNGLNEATKITISGASTSSTLVNYGTINLNSDAVVSLFVKKDTAQYILIDVQGVYGVTFDFLNEEVFPLGAVDNYGVEKYNDGWFRIWFYKSSTGAGSQTYSIRFSDGTGVFGFPSGDSPIGKSAYIWGAQATIGTYPVNYIPNNGAGSVTREADLCYGAGTVDTFNSSEGVLYAEISGRQWNGAEALLTISDGTTANRIYLRYSSSNFLAAIIIANAIEVIFSTPLASLGEVTDMNKIAIKYKQNDCALWINGVEVLSDLSTSALFPSGTLTTFAFDSGSGSNRFYGRVKDLRYYNTALADSELLELTKQ